MRKNIYVSYFSLFCGLTFFFLGAPKNPDLLDVLFAIAYLGIMPALNVYLMISLSKRRNPQNSLFEKSISSLKSEIRQLEQATNNE